MSFLLACFIFPASTFGESKPHSGLPAPYTVSLQNQDQVQKLVEAGFDIAESQNADHTVTIVASPTQVTSLRDSGFHIRSQDVVNTSQSLAPPNPGVSKAIGFDVFRPWSIIPGVAGQKNLKAEFAEIAMTHSDIVKEVKIGTTILGQDILAYKVTKDATTTADGSRPAVLFNAAQHAREWLTVELARRFIDYLATKKADSDMKNLLSTTEIWIVPVSNPDGYDFTFMDKSTRYWRKNLRDVNNDGRIDVGDGVDLNRNFSTHWGHDNEGSVPESSGETYRGSAPQSEPETKTLAGLMDKIKPKLHLNIHSYGEMLLLPDSWQVESFPADTPLLRTLIGDSEKPAIPGYHIDGSAADSLYLVHGDAAGDSFHRFGSQSFTPEVRAGYGPPVGKTQGDSTSYRPAGFVFQDSETDIQSEFNRILPFFLNVAKTAKQPLEPVSDSGNKSPDFEIKPFPVSYGVKQPVEVNAKRILGEVRVFWKINGGATQNRVATEWSGGKVYGKEGSHYYHYLRADVTGANAADQVEVWFEGGGKVSKSFTYRVADVEHRRVLLLSAEDYRGVSPNIFPSDSPRYLDMYLQALRENGVSADVYDIDAQGRKAPDPLGILRHYDLVIWYTGDDMYVRDPGQPGGTGTTRLFRDEVVNMRDYLNEGGKLIVMGKNALQGSLDELLHNPLVGGNFCPNDHAAYNMATVPMGQKTSCIRVANDFLEYWLGVGDYMPTGLTPSLTDKTALYRVGLEELDNNYKRAMLLNVALKKLDISVTDPPAPPELPPSNSASTQPSNSELQGRKQQTVFVKIASPVMVDRKKRLLTFRLQCPSEGKGRCDGKVKFMFTQKKKALTLGAQGFNLSAKQRKSFRIRLAKSTLRYFRQRRTTPSRLAVQIAQKDAQSIAKKNERVKLVLR